MLKSLQTLLFIAPFFLWSCDGDSEPPPLSPEQADLALETAQPVIDSAATSAAQDLEDPFTDIDSEMSCADGGRVAVQGNVSDSISGSTITSTATLDMDFLACSANGSMMDGSLRHVETVVIDFVSDEVEYTGSSRGTIEFTGAVMGACRFNTSWTIDVFTGEIAITGRVCGQPVDTTFVPGPGAQWDADEAADFAQNVFLIGDSAASEVKFEYFSDTGTIAVDIAESQRLCNSGEAARITGTLIRSEDDRTEDYDLMVELSDCDGWLRKGNGHFVYTSTESPPDTEASISGELTVDDLRYPSSACAFDLKQTTESGSGRRTITGTACGHEVMTSYP